MLNRRDLLKSIAATPIALLGATTEKPKPITVQEPIEVYSGTDTNLVQIIIPYPGDKYFILNATTEILETMEECHKPLVEFIRDMVQDATGIRPGIEKVDKYEIPPVYIFRRHTAADEAKDKASPYFSYSTTGEIYGALCGKGHVWLEEIYFRVDRVKSSLYERPTLQPLRLHRPIRVQENFMYRFLRGDIHGQPIWSKWGGIVPDVDPEEFRKAVARSRRSTTNRTRG